MPLFEATYFTTSDNRFFPGTVALINSLRLTGNPGEVVVFDLGLSEVQRRRLSTVATVQAPPSVRDGAPKVLPYSNGTLGRIVVIDSDMLVVASLNDMLGEVEQGKICLYPDPDQRWFEEWREAFDLTAPPRQQRYLNSGFVAFSVERWPRLLERWAKANRRLPHERSTHPENPFRDVDQDALNAILMSEIPPDAVSLQPAWAHSHPDTLTRVRIVDERDLTCTYEERRVTILHHSLRPKMWEPLGWQRDPRQAYVRLLRRVLRWDDVPLRLEDHELPLWLRQSTMGRLAFRGLTIGHATPGAKGAVKAAIRAGRAIRRSG